MHLKVVNINDVKMEEASVTTEKYMPKRLPGAQFRVSKRTKVYEALPESDTSKPRAAARTSVHQGRALFVNEAANYINVHMPNVTARVPNG
jgi:hypothetical protein